jgi:hypothetical protein
MRVRLMDQTEGWSGAAGVAGVPISCTCLYCSNHACSMLRKYLMYHGAPFRGSAVGQKPTGRPAGEFELGLFW